MIRGRDAINEIMKRSGGMEIIKIEDGGSKLLRLLQTMDEIVCVYEHVEQFNGEWKTVTCLDRNENKKGICPVCTAGKIPKFVAYIPVVDKSDDNKVKVLKASKKMLGQIMGMEDEYGDLRARDVKIVRKGKGLQTEYQFFIKDIKKEDLSGYEIPDIESRIEPKTRDSIIAMMEGAAVDVSKADDGDDEQPKHPFF